MGERQWFVPVSRHFIGTHAQLSKGRQSDECATCLQVNGGIELWLWSRVLEAARGLIFCSQTIMEGVRMCVFCEHTHLAEWIWCN